MAKSNLPQIGLTRGDVDTFERSAEKEWLVTNGIGGFASGTAAGACTRRYHGLLVAALKPPIERTIMVAKLEVFVDYDGCRFALTSNEYADGTLDPRGYCYLERFGIEGTIPIWQYVLCDARLLQRVAMVHGENTTVVSFTLRRASGPLRLELRPLCTYRDYHSHTHGSGWNLQVNPSSVGCEIRAFDGARPYRLFVDRGNFETETGWYWNYRHRAESARGLDDHEDLFSPGAFIAELSAGDTVTLTLTAEPETRAAALMVSSERSRQAGLLDAIGASQPQWVQSLALAADQFIVTRTGAGEGAKSIIAGYPWFSDWGRDTMIALPGLTLAMGRLDVAADILRTFARFVSEGMLPNRFPDAGEAPEYNTVDATLWYFDAVERYFEQSGDRALIASLYPILSDIIDWHLKGTRYGIHVDRDGLLFAGEPGVQLTWMDAKVGDWVVTPRIGKPVEINALWYRALHVMQVLGSALSDGTSERRFATLASGVAKAFRERYWLPDHGYLADVIDGPDGTDTSLRPNQIFAVSLGGSLLERDRQRAVVDVCARKLWTPVGLRSLAAEETGYIGHYGGGPVERDAAYHQGTVWSWLLGPFALAHYAVYQNAVRARAWLDGIEGHLRQACIGSISEIFSGDEPHKPEGCFAQAWSVAEVLRAWFEIERIEASNQQLKGEAAS